MLTLLWNAAAAEAAPWSWYPWLSILGGYENDRLPDPDLNRFAVPGGTLMGLSPGFRLGNTLSNRTRLDLWGQFSYERFQNTESRSQFGGVVTADLRVQAARSWIWRTTTAGSYYADSVYETANRFGGGLETGFGYVRRGWSLELLGGVEGRRYGNLDSFDDAGVLGTYSEIGLIVGLNGSVRAGSGLSLSGRVTRQRTDARDPLYDAGFWLMQGSVRSRFVLGTVLTLNGLGQTRRFQNRATTEDDDSYWQLGVGLERGLTEKLGLNARYAYARFSDPLGTSDDLQRFTVALTWEFGRSPSRIDPGAFVAPEGDAPAPLRENDTRLFRCHAPDAEEVALVGDFNGWDPRANPLRPAGDGWWQAEVRLPAGSHQYAYLVDGRSVTPADAEITVDDGFGGENGLIRVESREP